MKVLDTDTLTHLFEKHPRAVARYEQETDEIAMAIVSRIEILRGRFAILLTAADGPELQRAQQRLDRTIGKLAELPNVLPVDAAAADGFDRLRQNKKLRRIGRADLLIACIALANRATVVTRNLKDFQQVPGLQVDNWMG